MMADETKEQLLERWWKAIDSLQENHHKTEILLNTAIVAETSTWIEYVREKLMLEDKPLTRKILDALYCLRNASLHPETRIGWDHRKNKDSETGQQIRDLLIEWFNPELHEGFNFTESTHSTILTSGHILNSPNFRNNFFRLIKLLIIINKSGIPSNDDGEIGWVTSKIFHDLDEDYAKVVVKQNRDGEIKSENVNLIRSNNHLISRLLKEKKKQ